YTQKKPTPPPPKPPPPPHPKPPPHVGLFRLGRVLHLMEGGVTFLSEEVIKAMGFSRVSYYD
ncbi:hypothetical protein JGX53_18955, partial [Acinetobacter baumannii]|nr:hypothetical protein [Acinetobacter baumannii]